MAEKVEYVILNVPLVGRNLAASRTPRLQPSVPAEYGDMLSDEVARGEWTIDPENGEPLSVKGETIPQHLENKIKPRPHWPAPVVLNDVADDVWTSGNLTRQGERLRELERFCGSKATALVAFNEEAARYGVKPGSTKPGTKPNTDGEKKPGDKTVPQSLNRDASTTNPWSDKFRGTEAERDAKIASILKVQGSKLSEALARAAGTTIGRPLRKAKAS